MLDILDALLLGAIAATVAIALIGSAAISSRSKVVAYLAAATWTILIVTIAALGGFVRETTGPFPAPVLAFLILMAGGLAAWFTRPAFRRAFLSVPLAGLIGVNALRILGVNLLILHYQGRLAAPFAISAGWGDIVTGIVAIPLTATAAFKGNIPRRLLTAWNAFGTLDLFAALAFGALSAPGTPIQIFTESPGTLAMGTLPWVVIPTLLVPVYLMTHFAIAVRLRSVAGERTAPSQVDNLMRRAA